MISISVLPPCATRIISSVAPASIEFSSNSLTTDDGRSITSPAAIWFASAGSKVWIRLKLIFSRCIQST